MHQNKAFLNGNGNCNCHCCGSAAPRPAPPALFDLSLPIVTVTTTRNTCNMEYLTGRLSILWLLGLSLLLFKTGSTEAQSKRASRVTSSRSFGTNVKPTSSNGISFDCPEEFGYYPHPSDCTQYYVCVFGGALLESCTGGLMYSHELQTCDWPRNVGCELVDTSSERGPARSQGQSQTHTQAQHVPSRVRFGAAFSSPGGTQKAPTVAPQYHRSPPQVIQAQVQHIPPPPPELRVPPNPVITSRGQPKPLIESQEDIAKLYAEAQETLPPVEEEESDRQQRVYRGQPSTVSQVQRDRDGIIHQASINAIPQSGKIASYAFGTAYRVESSSPSSLGAPPPANVFVQPTPQAPSPQLEPNRNYYNASIFNHGGGYQPPQQQQQQQQQQLQPTPFQQATPQQQHQLQPQASPHPYDSSYYSVYDDDIDLYRDIEYQQQQQQDQQQPSVPQYQPTVRQQQPHSTYRPLELSATPTPPQKSSYSNQQTLAYSSDYDEDINAQIEQENLYDQPTRSPQRVEQVAIQRLDSRPSPSTDLSPTTPATRPDALTYYDTVTTPNPPQHGPADYSYSSSAEYAFGSAEDYDLRERTLTRAKSTARTYTDDYDLIANVVGPTSKSTMAPPTRTQNTKSTSALSMNPSKSSITNTQILEVTKSTTTTTTTTTTPFPSTTTTKLARNNNRNRGNAMYANQDRDVLSTPNRGTHPPRTRPTLKPSGTIVSKAQEFVDIYRYPPTRPDPIYPQPTPDKTAAKCRKDVCLLPDCYCGGKDIPGDLPVESIPQIVLLTFDDSVNDLNKQLYTDLFEKGRVNPNGCPITATFYVSHEWTDYSQVQNLYADGHEMASHTVSHSFGEQFSQKKWTREISGQREILAAYGGVKLSDVRGMRAPFLSVGGNKMYKMLYDSNFTYDSSMPVYENRPPSWPYTLDYKIFHDCMIPPCPTRSYPGVWQVPMVMWQDLNGGRCSMGDACSNPSDADGVTKMIMKNFERHYTTNRAPFGLFYHAAWFTQPHHKEGFIKFLDAINAMQDVWIITNWQALQWVRDPTPTSRINSFQPFQCDYSDRPKRCNNPKVCNLWHKSGVRYMKTCQPCPDIYPWTGKSGIRSSRIDNEVEEPAA
ncbi:uncharacterized protein LOC119548810 isoform X6 [Drosophila subpulchrella]|uniref:uncharacterized protein LOC119548810 isoform X6 n=1 Tax=Drosophila subpulchrella TaxID=1486046 RepID=UPI0018A17556|nr:uncharacterized protein LOC119548810 isoform X6 [Drosophila subpulchrella]